MNPSSCNRSVSVLGNRSRPRAWIAVGAILMAAVLAGCPEASTPDPSSSSSRPERTAQPEATTDFDGEADPDRMTLGMKTWIWTGTEYDDGTTNQPVEEDAFTLRFTEGRVHGTTDCNGFTGAYTSNAGKLTFDDRFALTRMFCPDSQESEFVAMLLDVESFSFTSQGKLILELVPDRGRMTFR